MKKIIFTLSLFISIFLIACNANIENTDNSDTLSTELSYPSSGNFYAVSDGSMLVANPIIYDVIVVNNDPSDDWAEYCLANTDVEAISNVIYNAVYQGRLTPYHYLNDSILSIDYVEEFEQTHPVSDLGKLQFDEEWYLDETNLTMSKKVNAITIGYQLINDLGEVYGYEAGFKIYLDNNKNVTR